MAKDRSSYDDSPSRAEELLEREEVNAVLADGAKNFARDARRVDHFVRRVALTLDSYRMQITRLHGEVQQTRLNTTHQGQATTLSPIDAVRYLSPEQMEQVFDAHMRERLGAVERARRDAEAARTDALRLLNALHFEIAGILEDPTVERRHKDLFGKLRDGLPPAPADAAPPAPAPAGDGLDDLFT